MDPVNISAVELASISAVFVAIAVIAFVAGRVTGSNLIRSRLREEYEQKSEAREAVENGKVGLLHERLRDRENRVANVKSELLGAREEIGGLQRDIREQHAKRAAAEEAVKTIPPLQARLVENENTCSGLQASLNIEHGRVADLKARLEASQTETREKVELLQGAKDQLKAEFQNIANKLFEDKSEKFSRKSESNLNNLITPLREQLTDFKKKVEDVYDKESRDRVSLFKEIGYLKDLNTRISEDALNLTRALKGDNKAQGNWGEMVLERVLEESGLQKGREYETQGSYQGGEGQRLRPDVVVHLPENKDVIIDSKVSLTDWERFCAAQDDQTAGISLKAHIGSMRAHIKGLGAKDYSLLKGLRSLDFVLMFVPVEAAFLKALEHEPALFSEAFDKNIMIVCPSTLLLTLRTIQNIWRYEYQNKNAQEIAGRAGALHDQFVLFAQSLEDVGNKIGKAKDAYDTTYRRLVVGKGNLVRRTQQLEKLGARTRKTLPENLLKAVDDEVDEAVPS